MGMKKASKTRAGILSLVVSVAAFAASCGANETVLRSGRETPVPSGAVNEKTTFAQDLSAMRTAGFTYVYVLRRKDSGIMEAEDLSVIKLQTAETNRRIKADNDRAVIIGSNNPVLANNMSVIYQRFSMEDYSEPLAVDANMNTNSVK
jgi:hypothetical protein